MDEDKIPEDSYAVLDFDDEDADELRNSEFIEFEPKTTKLKETSAEKISEFYDENNKIIGTKIIEKKSGAITEIKYSAGGAKTSVIIRGKDKKILKNIEYYENGIVRLSTNYAKDSSYKSIAYNVDGSRKSYVVKHKDGTSDSVYYNADGKGGNLIVKMDAAKNVLEKRLEK